VLDLSGQVEEFASQLVDRAHASEDEQVQKLMVHNADFLQENNRLKNDLGKSKMEYNEISTKVNDLVTENRDLRQKAGIDRVDGSS
jgi:uncharacterized protein YoxC